MNIYAFEKTDRFFDIIDFEVPASWFQSINPLLIVILGYSVSAFWVYMKKKSLVSSSIIKIGVGISIMGLGFIFMFFASVESEILENLRCIGLF